MNNPLRDNIDTTTSQISVYWIALSSPQNGDSSVTSYNLQWDAGTSGISWINLQGFSPLSTVLSYIVTTGVNTGVTYQFRLRSRNIYGWGPYSSTISIKAATVPS